MSGGCTDCGKKGGCDARKHGMFAAIDEALARLYPTRRWDERDEAGVGGGRRPGGRADALAARAGGAPQARATLYRPGARRGDLRLRLRPLPGPHAVAPRAARAALGRRGGAALASAIAEGR